MDNSYTNNSTTMNHHHLNEGSGEMDIDIKKFFMMLWRRKVLIIFVMLLCAGAVFLYIKTVAPKYSAKSSVLIENRMNPGGELRSFISSVRVDTSVILSEAEVLKSRALARDVIDRLDLMNDPEFNLALRAPQLSLFDKIFKTNSDIEQPFIGNDFKHLSVYKTEMQGSDKSNIDKNIGLVVDIFLEHIRVRPVPGSFVLQVEYDSTDPAKAALIANTVVDAYIEQNLSMKFKANARVTKWLDNRLDALRSQVRDAEDEVEQFKLQHDLNANDIVDFNEQQLSGLNNQLVLAKTQEAEAQARLQQIQNWIKRPNKIKITQEAEKSRVIQALKLKEASVLNEISDLSVRYGSKYPKMVSKQLELDQTRSQIKQELTSIAKGIKANLKFASNRVQAIEDALNGVENIKEDDGKTNIRLRELVRESEASQSILDAFLHTYKRAADQGELQESQARVISYATIPFVPYSPNKPLFMSLAVVLSFFIGVVLALLLEKMTSIFRTLEQLENETGYTCLGLIPFVPKLDPNKPIADYIIGKGGTRMAEAMRTLRMVINLRAKNSDQKSKVITVTSCVPEEGKTTLSAWMARVAAKSGERVIVLDCDLRRPRLSDAFGKNPQNTIVEYLTGKCTLEEAIYRDPGTNMHAVFARSVPNNALDLLTKTRMSNLIEALREQYDLIIIDSPACLSVSDARLLSSKSDQTVFAVSWSDTPIEVVNAGLKQFADVGNDALALVLTNVDMKQYSKYGFSEAVHYYSAYNPYYAD